MPELPEVETVRRGLEPAMEGARFVKVVAHRGDLRWPLPKDFVQRLEGKTVTGLGRRAKYLLADLSSGDVLVMHLGMSGSFRVEREAARRRRPAHYYHERSQGHGARPRRVPHVVGRDDPLQRSAPLRLDEDRRAAKARRGAAAARARPRAARQRIRRRDAGGACQGKNTSLKAALLDQRVVAGLGNIYVCEALNRARLSPKRNASTIANRNGAPNERAERAGRRDQGGAATRRSRPAAHRCAIIAAPTASSAMFQHHFRVYDREGKPCPTRGCRAPSSASCRTDARRFFVRCARNDFATQSEESGA